MNSGRIERQAPAKINLFLRVLGQRDDGYHDLDSVFVPLDLCDTVQIALASSNQLEVRCEGAPDLDGEHNLIYRALSSLREALGGAAPGFRVRVKKRIPVAAGLGGGSSDAAAALLGAQALLGAPLPRERLFALGAEVGADVPFFLAGPGPAWVRGKGERVEPVTDLPVLPLVLISPAAAVSTAEVFRVWDELPAMSLTKPAANGTKPRFFESVARVAAMVHNDLECVTAKRVPEVATSLAGLRAAGAIAAAMSGSGPSVFGLFESASAAKAASREMTSGPDCLVQVVTGLGRSGLNGQH